MAKRARELAVREKRAQKAAKKQAAAEAKKSVSDEADVRPTTET
jgi:hypothetical protein